MVDSLRNYLGRKRGFAGCGRCGDTFDWKPYHVTNYAFGKGCLPLCEECWGSLTAVERIPYYRELWDRWNRGGFWIMWHDGTWHLQEAPEPWPVLEAAVLREEAA